jgi:hypothetical protein
VNGTDCPVLTYSPHERRPITTGGNEHRQRRRALGRYFSFYEVGRSSGPDSVRLSWTR